MGSHTFSRWLLAGVLGAAVASSASVVVSGASGAKHPSCAKQRGKTLAGSHALRVFVKTSEGGLGQIYTLYGCRKGSRTVRKLGVDGEDTETVNLGYASAKIAGKRFAAVTNFVELPEDESENSETARVFDVRSGKRQGHITVDASHDGEVLEAYGLTPGGGVAVLARGQTDSRVIVNDAGGLRTLATATSITMLSVTGATVSWMQGGQHMMATLSGTAR